MEIVGSILPHRSKFMHCTCRLNSKGAQDGWCVHRGKTEKAEEQFGRGPIGKGFLGCIHDCGLHSTGHG